MRTSITFAALDAAEASRVGVAPAEEDVMDKRMQDFANAMTMALDAHDEAKKHSAPQPTISAPTASAQC